MATGKSKAQAAPTEPEWDHSVLQRPITLGTQNVKQILHCMSNGSREVKDVLLNECSILFECKVCRNLFRSLANLLAHKRIYCTEHLCETMSLCSSLPEPASDTTVTVIPQPVPAVPTKTSPQPVIRLTPVDGNPNAVFQKVLSPPPEKTPVRPPRCSDSKARGHEKLGNSFRLTNSLKLANSVKLTVPERPLDSPKLEVSETPSGSAKPLSPESQPCPESDKKPSSSQSPTSLATSSRASYLSSRTDCDFSKLTCLNCKTEYTSVKTLYLHMVSLHSKTRRYYSCPFCKTTFVQMWGVTRHLVSVHKQTRDQIMQLKDSIQSGVLLRKSRLQQMADGLLRQNGHASPPDGRQLHQCSKCRRQFGRRSSCICHEKFCFLEGPRKAPRGSRKGIPRKKIPSPLKDPPSGADPPHVVLRVTSPQCSLQSDPESSAVETPDSEEKLALEFPEPEPKRPLDSPEPKPPSELSEPPKLPPESPKQPPESGSRANVRPKRIAEKKMNKDFINSQTLKWRSANKIDTHAVLPGPPNKRISPAVERKILSIIDYDRLTCLRCDRLFSTFSNLRRHAAIHLGYSRYQCTRCSYQSYNRSDCRSHVQRVHADAHDVERMIVHVPGEEERHPMATRFPRLDSLSTLVTRSGAYPKRPPPDHLGYCLQNAK